jgi:hypothetical protein
MKEFNPNEDRKFTMDDLHNGHVKTTKLMEEQILKSIRKNVTQLNNKDGITRLFGTYEAAKEIADTFERFMEWYIFGNHPFCGWYENVTEKFISDEVSDKKWSIPELFTYWLNHINETQHS